MNSNAVVDAARRSLGPVGAYLPVPFTSAPPADLQRTAAGRLERAGYRSAWVSETVGGKDPACSWNTWRLPWPRWPSGAYHRVMGRWEPNARGRLAQAALTLYAMQGFEQTTAAEIARAAGLTERTFFRHFADKREVLFYGSDSLQDLIVGVIADAPATATAMDAVNRALQAVAAMVQENPEPARLRNKIMSANPELREREFVKLADIAAAMSVALRDRGVPEPAASLLGETGVAIYRIAFARWIGEPGQPDLAAILRECTAELKSALGDRLPSPA